MFTWATSEPSLVVACEGTNRAVYWNAAPWPASSYPPLFTSHWQYLGGVSTSAPAVEGTQADDLTFITRGLNGHIYWSRETPPTSPLWTELTNWACIGSPALVLQLVLDAATFNTSNPDPGIFACDGTDHALWWSESTYSWGPTTSLGGGLIGGPGVAFTTSGPVFVVEGTNHAVWERTPTTGWTSLGGSVIGGVGAAALN